MQKVRAGRRQVTGEWVLSGTGDGGRDGGKDNGPPDRRKFHWNGGAGFFVEKFVEKEHGGDRWRE